MRVFIAEKPSVAKCIADAIGNLKKTAWGYENSEISVTSCFGHLLKLQDPDYYLDDNVPNSKKGGKIWRIQDLPIIPTEFKKTFTDSSAKERFMIIKKLLSNANEVINAGDPDREGQILIDEVINACNYKGKILRYWSAAMDEISVKRALNDLKPNSKFTSWGTAADARAQIDWLIGMNLSRGLTLTAGDGKLLSVGRVQTPILKLIYDRNEAIKKFKPINHYVLHAILNNEIQATYKADQNLVDENGYILNKSCLEQIATEIEGKHAEVQSFNSANKTISPPLPYTLTDLQSDCAASLNISPKETLAIAQSLYEKHKIISYPRSSCPYLPTSQKSDVATLIAHISNDFPDLNKLLKSTDPSKNSKLWNDDAVNQEAHTAIIPTLTDHSVALQNLSDVELEIFKMISKRFAMNFLPDHTYTLTTIIFKIEDHIFEAKIKTIINNGFKSFLKEKENPDDDEIISNIDLASINEYICTSSNIMSKKTAPPKPFTQGSIVKAMRSIAQYVDDPEEKKLLRETDGLGTEATRAAILDSLFKRNYIELRKNKLFTTADGETIISSVPARYKSISLTAQCEAKLDEIKNGNGDTTIFVNKESAEIKEIINSMKNTIDDNATKCECGSTDIFRFKSKFGDKQFIWKCNGCNNYFSDKNGTPGAKIEKSSNEQKYKKSKCPSCSNETLGRYESKFKKGAFYWFCSNCKKNFFDDTGKIGNEIVKK